MKKIEKIRHSLAHILAYAVQELYPGTKFGIGPAIENGFYYDFDLPKKISSGGFAKD
jgi:threonyl-tRNA synthetase